MSDATRLFCLRCQRVLRGHATDGDTVSGRKGQDCLRHDQCGGAVAMSKRRAEKR